MQLPVICQSKSFNRSLWALITAIAATIASQAWKATGSGSAT